MSGRKRVSRKVKQSHKQNKTLEDDEETDDKRPLDGYINEKYPERNNLEYKQRLNVETYSSKKMATRSNNTNDQISSVGKDETNDNNPSLRSAPLPNGYHDIKVTSNKLCDNINSTVSSLREGNALKSATAATGKVISPVDSMSTGTTDRLQPIAGSLDNILKQCDDSNIKNKRRKRFAAKKSKNNKKSKKLAENDVVMHTIPEKKSTDPIIIESERSNEKNLHRVAVLVSIRDKFTLSQDMCLCCGSIGKGIDNSLIACFQCGQSYHHYCVSTKLTRSVIVNGWRCLDCAVCEGCGRAGDEDRLLLCDECDISYHTYCLNPRLDKVPEGEWKCHRCVSCYDCGSTSPGINCQWVSNYTQCGSCSSTSICPKCDEKYVNDDIIIQCNNCDRWFHGRCEGINNEHDAKMYSDADYICSLCDPNVYLCNKLVNHYIYEGNKVKIHKLGHESSDFYDQFNPIRAGLVFSEDIPFTHLIGDDGNNPPARGRLKRSRKNRFVVSKIMLTKSGVAYMKKLEGKRKAAWGEECVNLSSVKLVRAKTDKKKLIRKKKIAKKLKVSAKTKKSNIIDSNSYLINTKNSKVSCESDLLKKQKKKRNLIRKKIDTNDQMLPHNLDNNFQSRYGGQMNGDQIHDIPYHQYLSQQSTGYHQNLGMDGSNDLSYPLNRPLRNTSIGSSGFGSKESTRGSEEFPNEIIDSILNDFGDNIGNDILNENIEVDGVFNIFDDYHDVKETMQIKNNSNEHKGMAIVSSSCVQNFNDPTYSHNVNELSQAETSQPVSILHHQMAKTGQIIKCQREESLGDRSTMASILYANLVYPNLRNQYPEITARIKVIERLWRKLEHSERAKYTAKAKENRKVMHNSSKLVSDKMTVKTENVKEDGILIPQAPLISHHVISERSSNTTLISNSDSPINSGTASWDRLNNIWAMTAKFKGNAANTDYVNESHQHKLNGVHQERTGCLMPVPKPIVCHKATVLTTTYQQQMITMPNINSNGVMNSNLTATYIPQSEKLVPVPNHYRSNVRPHNQPYIEIHKDTANQRNYYNQSSQIHQGIVHNNSSQVGFIRPAHPQWPQNPVNTSNQLIPVNQSVTNRPYIRPPISTYNYPLNVRQNVVSSQYPASSNEMQARSNWPIYNSQGVIAYRNISANNNNISNNNSNITNHENVMQVKQEFFAPSNHNQSPTPMRLSVPPSPTPNYQSQPNQNLMPAPNNVIRTKDANEFIPGHSPSTPNMTEVGIQPRFTYPPLASSINHHVVGNSNQWNQPISPVYNQSPNIRTWIPIQNQNVIEQRQFIPMTPVNSANNMIIQNSPRMMIRNQIPSQQNLNVIYPMNAPGSVKNANFQCNNQLSPSYLTTHGNSTIVATNHTISDSSSLNKKKGKRKKDRQKIKENIDNITSVDPKEVSDPVTRARIEALNKFSEHAKSPEIRQLALVGAKEHLENYHKENSKDVDAVPIMEEMTYNESTKETALEVDDLTTSLNTTMRSSYDGDLEFPEYIMAPIADHAIHGDKDIIDNDQVSEGNKDVTDGDNIVQEDKDINNGDKNIMIDNVRQIIDNSERLVDGETIFKNPKSVSEQESNENCDSQRSEHNDCIEVPSNDSLKNPKESDITTNLPDVKDSILDIKEQKDLSILVKSDNNVQPDTKLNSFINKDDETDIVQAEPVELHDFVLPTNELKEVITKNENVTVGYVEIVAESKEYLDANDDINDIKGEDIDLRVEDFEILSPSIDNTMEENCPKKYDDLLAFELSQDDIPGTVLLNATDPLVSEAPVHISSNHKSEIHAELPSGLSSELPILLPIDEIQEEKLACEENGRTSNSPQTHEDTEELTVNDSKENESKDTKFVPVLPKLNYTVGLTGLNQTKTSVEDDITDSPQISDMEFSLEIDDRTSTVEDTNAGDCDNIATESTNELKQDFKNEVQNDYESIGVLGTNFENNEHEAEENKSSPIGGLSKLNPNRRRKTLRWKHWKQSFEKKARSERNEPLSYQVYLRLKSAISPPEHIVDGRSCEFCFECGDGVPEFRGRLLNLDIDKWVHINCALWSSEVYETCDGALHMVQDAYAKGKKTSCFLCKKLGATVKCHQRNCNKCYHFYCAIENKCHFFADKTVYCSKHLEFASCEIVLESFKINRLVFIKRDELMQISRVLKDQVDKGYILRVGSLIFHSLGQLMPRHLSGFHSSTAIYPPGYQVKRIFWSPIGDNMRCFYICKIWESNDIPKFNVTFEDKDQLDLTIDKSCPKEVWQQPLISIKQLREKNKRIKLFTEYITGEDLFGLLDPWILRLLESLPGIDRMKNYRMRYGRCPYLELPLAINPTGSARTELVVRSRFKRRHTLCTSTAVSSRAPVGGVFDTHQSYTKLFVHSKTAQYRKLKSEWRSNIYLGRSLIQGLGLFARKNIEKNTMVIEYIGAMIRNEVANKRERIYQKANHGIYMFRIDPDFVIDATEDGGLARYINHSCQPNCVAEVVTFDSEPRIIIISNRRIDKGEELTYDYKFEYEDDLNKIPCMCGAPNCRGWMN